MLFSNLGIHYTICFFLLEAYAMSNVRLSSTCLSPSMGSQSSVRRNQQLQSVISRTCSPHAVTQIPSPQPSHLLQEAFFIGSRGPCPYVIGSRGLLEGPACDSTSRSTQQAYSHLDIVCELLLAMDKTGAQYAFVDLQAIRIRSWKEHPNPERRIELTPGGVE